MKAARDLIVIGASLGGLDAIRTLAAALPATLPAAVMVVLHTHASSPMLLADIIGRATKLPVSYGARGECVQPGHIYLASPDQHMVVRPPGFIQWEAGPKVHHSRPAADVLFVSAAQAYGARLIGVVLTGGNCDGTAGLVAIRAAGGVTIVQDPDDAVSPEMPRNAIAGGHPDHTVPLSQMAPLLRSLVGY